MRHSFAVFRSWSLLDIGRPVDGALTPEQIRANIRYLVWDITWYGILVGTTINLLQVFVVRLGASSLLVGAVTYGPALISIFWQIPAAQWMRHVGHRMRWVLGAGILYRSVFLVMALLPFLVADRLPELLVLALVVQAFATTISATAFLSMMADAVPPEQIPQMVSWRMAGFGLTSTLSTLFAGLLLARLPFPLNYQVLFLVGFAASLLSWWSMTRIRVADRQPVRVARKPWREQLTGILSLSRFLKYVFIVWVLQLGLGMVVPLMPLHAVRQLGASDAQVSLIVTTVSASSVIGSLLTRRIMVRIGRERMLQAGAVGYLFYPLFLSLAPGVGWLIPAAAVGGFFSATISVTLFDNLLAVTPDGDKTGYVSVYNLFVNAALFAGPLLAGVIGRGAAGPARGLQMAAAACLVAGLLCSVWIREIQRQR